jgi:hypothetical protein
LHSATGRAAPIDAAPDVRGNIVMEPGGRYRVLAAGEEPAADVPRYTSHFASCPHARTWRR